MASLTQWIWVWASSRRWWRCAAVHGVPKSWTQLGYWTTTKHQGKCGATIWKGLCPWMTAESRNFHSSKWPGLCCDMKDKRYCVMPLRFGSCFFHQLSHHYWYSALGGSVIQNALRTPGPPWEPLSSQLWDGLDSDPVFIKKSVGSLPGPGECGAGAFRSASTYVKLNTVKWILWSLLRRVERTLGKNNCSKSGNSHLNGTG